MEISKFCKIQSYCPLNEFDQLVLVVEWSRRLTSMLEVRGSNPGQSGDISESQTFPSPLRRRMLSKCQVAYTRSLPWFVFHVKLQVPYAHFNIHSNEYDFFLIGSQIALNINPSVLAWMTPVTQHFSNFYSTFMKGSKKL